MSSGKTHTKINLISVAALAALWAIWGKTYISPEQASWTGAGMLIGTLLITPDLDLKKSDPKNNWGLFRFIWTPYSKLSKHRGVSHSYIRGPLIRGVYLLSLLWVGWFLAAQVNMTQAPNLSWRDKELIFYTSAGYFIAQWVHLITDGIYPWQKGRI